MKKTPTPVQKNKIEKIQISLVDPRLGSNYTEIHKKTEEAVIKLLDRSKDDKVSIVELTKIVDSVSRYLKSTFSDPDFLIRHINTLPTENKQIMLTTISPDKKDKITKKTIDDEDLFK